MPTRDLDCRQLNCPMPIVQIALAIKTLSPGDLLRVSATDPAFKPDLHAWAGMTGHTIVEFRDGAVQEALVRIS